jgi:hypothetical protein
MGTHIHCYDQNSLLDALQSTTRYKPGAFSLVQDLRWCNRLLTFHVSIAVTTCTTSSRDNHELMALEHSRCTTSRAQGHQYVQRRANDEDQGCYPCENVRHVLKFKRVSQCSSSFWPQLPGCFQPAAALLRHNELTLVLGFARSLQWRTSREILPGTAGCDRQQCKSIQ